MSKIGVLIEIDNDNDEVKKTSLGVLTAAAGGEIYALVIDGNAAKVQDKLSLYGAAHIVNITASCDTSVNPDLEADAITAAIKEFNLEALLGTASSAGKDIFARIAANMDESLVSDCVKVNIAEKRVQKSHFSGKTYATLKVDSSLLTVAGCTIFNLISLKSSISLGLISVSFLSP